jgi:hypothetical protein
MANFRNRVSFLIEILGNTQLFAGEGFGSAAFASSFSGNSKASLRPLSDQGSLKLCKSAEERTWLISVIII